MTIKVIDLLNPLDLENIQTRHEEWRPDKALSEYIPADGEYIVSVSGGIVPVSQWDYLIPESDDTIVIVPVLEGGGGGGGGKTILRLVAFIALMVFTMGTAAWALPALSGLQAGSTALLALQAGASMVGSLLINALLPAQPQGMAGMDESPSYGIAFPNNTSSEGVAVPVVYGKHRMAGNYIGFATENADKTQIFYGLINAGEGPIAGISDIQIGDQPIENFTDLATEIRTGTGDQMPIRWFADTMTPLGVGVNLPSSSLAGKNQQWMTRLTNRAVDKLRIDMLAPEGVAWITDKGELKPFGTRFQVRYRRVAQDGTPIVGEDWRSDVRMGSGIGEGSASYIINPPRDGGGGGSPGPNEPFIPLRPKTYFGGVVPETGDFAPGGVGSYTAPTLPVGSSVVGSTVVDNASGGIIGSVIRQVFDQGSGVSRPAGAPSGTYATLEMKGQTRQPFRQTYITPEIPFGYYEVQVRREDQEYPREDKAVDKMTWESLVQIVSDDVAYRHTALLGLRIRFNDQLNSTPQINYLHHGVLVRQIDSNGNWAMGTSENPAWACLDMLTNPRYGGRVALSQIDVDAFVQWANYCEQKSLEFNMVLDQSITIWDAMKYVCRAGRAQVIRTGTKYSVVMESASEPVMMFSEQNMVKGSFAVDWLPLAERANAVEVSYWDAAKNYEKTTLKITDENVVEGVNERVAQITLYGVTSRVQAMQEAYLQININKYLTRTVSFEATMDALACTIGSVIAVKHLSVDWQESGRFEAPALSSSTVVLDRPVTLRPGVTNKLLVHEPVFACAVGGAVTSVNVNTQSLAISGLTVLAAGGAGAPDWLKSTTLEITTTGVVRQFSIAAIQGTAANATIYIEPQHLSDLSSAVVGGTARLLMQDAIIELTATALQEIGGQYRLAVSGFNALSLSGAGHWMLGPESSIKKLYRVMAIEAGSEQTNRKISAAEYDARVYQALNILPNPEFSREPQPFNNPISHVRNLVGTQRVLYQGSGKAEFWMDLHWQLPGTGQYNGALVFMRNAEDRTWQTVGKVDGDGMHFNVKAPVNSGVYEIAVLAKDPQGGAPSLSSAPSVVWDLYSDFSPVTPSDVVATGNIGFNAVTWGALQPFKVDRSVIAVAFIPDKEAPAEGWPAEPAEGWPDGIPPWEIDETGTDALALPFIYEEWVAARAGVPILPGDIPPYHRATLIEAGPTFNFQHANVSPNGRYRYWVACFDRAQPDTRSFWVRAPSLVRPLDVNDLVDTTEIQSAILADVNAEIALIQTELSADLAVLNGQITTLNGDVTSLTTTVNNLAELTDDLGADIIAESLARSNADSALATQISAATARIDSAEALIASESTARVAADTSFASQLTTLEGRVTSAETGITGNATATSNLTTRVTAAEASISSQSNQITQLTNSVEARSRVYYQTSAPAGTSHGLNDIWFDSDAGNRPYRWNGTSWVLVEDSRWTERNRVFAQTSAPTGTLTTGDLWIDTDDNNRLYRWNGSAWVAADDLRIAATASAVTSLTTRVTTVEGTTSSQGNQITVLQNEVNDLESGLSATNTSVSNLTSRVTAAEGTLTSQGSSITQLNSQVNSRARVYFQNDAPSGTLHAVNDLWFETDNNNRPHRWNGSAWVLAEDGRWSQRNRVFAQNAAPTGDLAIGDLWIDTDDGNKLYRWNGSSWINIEDSRLSATATGLSALTTRVTTVEGQVSTQSSQITSLQNSVSQRNRVFAQTSAPSSALGLLNGDLWIDTDDNNRLYRWSSSSWLDASDARFSQRNRVFAQTSAPAGASLNDIWMDTDDNNRLYRWDGASWISAADARIDANSSAISGLQSRVTTTENSITSISSQVTSLNTSVNQRNRIFAQPSPPTASNVGDMWIDTDGGNKIHIWSGSIWVESSDQTFNNRATVHVQNTAPTGTNHRYGDLWFNWADNNRPHHWNGSSWVAMDDPRTSANASAISTLNSQVTTINGQISSQASSITTLNSQMGANTATISSVQSTVNGLSASASLTLDVNGRITGYRINGSGTTGSVDWIADRFRLLAPGSASPAFYYNANRSFPFKPGSAGIDFGVEVAMPSLDIASNGGLTMRNASGTTYASIGALHGPTGAPRAIYSCHVDVAALNTAQFLAFRDGPFGSLFGAMGSHSSIHGGAATECTIFAPGTLRFTLATASNTATLDTAGNFATIGNVTGYSSDARLKINKAVIERPLEKIDALGGYEFDWDMKRCAEAGFTPNNEHEHGLIAQEVQAVIPDAVTKAAFGDDYLTVRYDRLVPLLLEGIKAQQRMIESLTRRVEELEAR